MKKKRYITVLFIFMIILTSCSNDNEHITTTCWDEPEYFFYVTPNLQWGERYLESTELVIVQYGTNIKKVSREGEGYTARVLVESDGILIERSEILLEDFPSEEYGDEKDLYFTIELTEETIHKNIGYVHIAMQKINEDGTYTNLLERTGYYAIKGDLVYSASTLAEVVYYHQKGGKMYLYYKYDTGMSEQIWFDNYDNIMYVACEIENEAGDGWDTVVEQYSYEKSENGGRYIAIDNEGNEVFVMEEIEQGIMRIGDKIYTEEVVVDEKLE